MKMEVLKNFCLPNTPALVANPSYPLFIKISLNVLYSIVKNATTINK